MVNFNDSLDNIIDLINRRFKLLLKVNFDALDNETNSKVNNIIEEFLEYLLPKHILIQQTINITDLVEIAKEILRHLFDLIDNLNDLEKSLPSKLIDFLFTCRLIYSSVPIYKEFDQIDKFLNRYTRLLLNKGEVELNKNRITFVITFLKKVDSAQNEDWTLLSYNSAVFEYLFWQIKSDELNSYVFEIFPSTMQMANNHLPSNQLIGLQCLNAFLTDSICYKILETNKYDELIYTKLFNLLYDYEEETFMLIMKNLTILIKKSLIPKQCDNVNGPIALVYNDNSKIDQIFTFMLDTIVIKGNKLTLIELYLESLNEQIISLAKCHLIKMSKKFFTTLNCLFEQIAHMSSCFSLLMITLKVLKHYLIEVDFIFNKQATMIILFNLNRMLIKSQYDMKTNEKKQIYQEILNIFHLIEMNCKNDNRHKILKQFCFELKQSNKLWTKIGSFESELDMFIERNALDVTK